MVRPSCATHLLSCLEQSSLDVVLDILSGSISYTCRHALHLQTWPVISLQTLGVWLCQWPNLTGMEHCAPHTKLYTGSSSRRFSYVLWLKVHSHQQLRACFLGSKRKLPSPACQVQLGLPSVVCHPRVVPRAPCTSVIRVLCQTLEPTAFLVHPVLAAIAEDAVAAHSSATGGT